MMLSENAKSQRIPDGFDNPLARPWYGLSCFAAGLILSRVAYNASMSEQVPEDLRRRARAWGIASAYLSDERVARLRAMTDEDRREIIASIFNGPVPKRIERESGLVTQQRLFRNLK